MPKENKTENRGGSRVHNAGYRKVRVEMFAMVEQLICSNAILTASLQHNELLQRKAHLKRNALREEISDTRAKVEELKNDLHEMRNFMEREHAQFSHKIEQQDEIIISMGEDAVKDDADKAKKEIN